MAWIQFCLIAFLLPWIDSDSAMYACHKQYKFFCNTSRECIHKFTLCDGYKDCRTGEDEVHPSCSSTTCLANGQVYCNTSLKCIPILDLCDGIDNCHDGEDEHTFACDVSSLPTTTTELTDEENVNSSKTTLIVIAAVFTVVVFLVGSICFLLARKRFKRQNTRMEPRRVFPVGIPPGQQSPRYRRRQSSTVYAEINEETMEHYPYTCEQVPLHHYNEINGGIVPLNELTDGNISGRAITKSEGKNEIDSTDETKSLRSVTQSDGNLGHICNADNANEVNARRRVVKSDSTIMCKDLEALCKTTKAGHRGKLAAKYFEEIRFDLKQFQTNYIHPVAGEDYEMLNRDQGLGQSIKCSLKLSRTEIVEENICDDYRKLNVTEKPAQSRSKAKLDYQTITSLT